MKRLGFTGQVLDQYRKGGASAPIDPPGSAPADSM